MKKSHSTKKTKVLRVISRLNVGGPAIHVTLLTAGLDPERYETILVSGVEAPEEGNMLHLAEEHGVTPVMIPNLGRELSPIRDISTVWQLYRLIRNEKPDIVHTHASKGGFVGRAAAILARVPVIVHTFHGHVLHGYFGPAKNYVFKLIERFLGAFCARIISVSQSCRQDLLGFGIGNETSHIHIPLGLDLKRFYEVPESARSEIRAEFGLPDDAFVVSMIARMVPIKRHEVLFRAIAKVLPRYPNTRFLMVGDGELRGHLETLAHELGIEKRCIFCGFRDDRERFYAASDLVALTSRNEGLPVVIIEAYASGTPVVATRVGGVPELIDDNVTGYIAKPEDPDSVAEGLMKALADPKKTEEMGRKAQKETIQKYSINRLIADIDSLYLSLMQNR